MSEGASAEPATSYVLGHTDHELQRLASQADLVDPITRRFLVDGGLATGMRVLDVGSGAGHVTFLAADIVGPTGEAIGVDRSEVAVAAATDTARSLGIEHASFRAGDPVELDHGGPYDAVIGRYVLQFQADPSAYLRSLLELVRPGGQVIFHELDWDHLTSVRSAPLYDQCCRWAEETIRRSGHQTHMGMNLRRTFVQAGLAAPGLRLEAMIAGGSQSDRLVAQLVGLIGSLAPEMQRLGVASEDDLGLDTLFERMRAEVIARDSEVVGRLQVGCWARR